MKLWMAGVWPHFPEGWDSSYLHQLAGVSDLRVTQAPGYLDHVPPLEICLFKNASPDEGRTGLMSLVQQLRYKTNSWSAFQISSNQHYHNAEHGFREKGTGPKFLSTLTNCMNLAKVNNYMFLSLIFFTCERGILKPIPHDWCRISENK